MCACRSVEGLTRVRERHASPQKKKRSGACLSCALTEPDGYQTSCVALSLDVAKSAEASWSPQYQVALLKLAAALSPWCGHSRTLSERDACDGRNRFTADQT